MHTQAHAVCVASILQQICTPLHASEVCGRVKSQLWRHSRHLVNTPVKNIPGRHATHSLTHRQQYPWAEVLQAPSSCDRHTAGPPSNGRHCTSLHMFIVQSANFPKSAAFSPGTPDTACLCEPHDTPQPQCMKHQRGIV